jgi:exodeoxyribonuclease VII small subunit
VTDLDVKMRELRAICDRVESGKLSLEESLAEYERGVALGREIDLLLSRAEQQVDLVRSDGTLEPFSRSPGGKP